MNNINWIHVEYGNRHSNSFLKHSNIISNIFRIKPNILVVQNNNNASLLAKNYIYGSNYLREFSGWTEGINYLSSSSPQWWIFSNDTFAQHRFFWGAIISGFLKRFSKHKNETNPTIIGDILFPNLLRKNFHYVSTYFFLLNHAALEKISFNLIDTLALKWIDESNSLQITTNKCPEQISYFIHTHLTDLKSNISWRNAQIVNQSNVNFLRFKAKAILLEHALSTKIADKNIYFAPIIDRKSINFLRIIRSLESRLSYSFFKANI